MFEQLFNYEAETGNGGAGETEDATGADKPNSGQVTYTTDQQAHIDRLIEERLSRAKAKWQADLDAKAAKETQAAEQKRLEDEKEYQKLLDLERGKVAALEPLQSQLDQAKSTLQDYEATVGDMLKAKIELLGETAKTAVDNLPGQPDALAKLKWLNANEKLFKPGTVAPAGGTPPRHKQAPPPNNQQQPTQPAQTYQPVIRF